MEWEARALGFFSFKFNDTIFLMSDIIVIFAFQNAYNTLHRHRDMTGEEKTKASFYYTSQRPKPHFTLLYI